MIKFPLGDSYFYSIITEGYYFVDKTPAIADVINDAKVLLFTRPRRFGKTLFLSMLQHFFAAEVYGHTTQGLFEPFKIAEDADSMQHQGKYPVIFINLKSIKDGNFETAYTQLYILIKRMYSEHRYLLDSPALLPEEKAVFQSILEERATSDMMKYSLRNLSSYLNRHTGSPVVLLIDEYDTPIQSAYLHNYYDEMIAFVRTFLGEALKDNPHLHKAVLTGILRVAKESLFSGLNNLKVYSILNSLYGQYFGFTEAEVITLLQKSGLTHDLEQIRQWYNGYQCGDALIYNPWSILYCLSEKGVIKPYWLNTSDNLLVKQLLQTASSDLKTELEQLLQGQPLEKFVDESMVFGDLGRHESAIWALLLSAGYLKSIQNTQVGIRTKCTLEFPNKEVAYLYIETVQEWFSDRIGEGSYQRFLNCLLTGNIEEFTLRLQALLSESSSYFDTTGTHPEKFYHGLVLGLIASLRETHIIKSNRESGYGRYDIMIIPHDHSQLGIVLEFKSITDEKIDLAAAAQRALQQIKDKQYETELHQAGIQQVLKLGLAFRGKDVNIQSDS